ncbi:sulfotransferase [Methylobacter sp.]|uniref:sulfotransferase n=1 Tax=Methylobacter sp. TaxID=2051955 RepID=UPI003DA6B55C
MNFQSVLIITYGRSGSTLLQGLLNSIEGCVVRGENYNMCHGLFLAYRALQETKAQFGNGDYSLSVTEPWFGAAWLDDQRFLQDARELVFHQLMPENMGSFPQCIGFKEIRYSPPNIEFSLLHAYLDFLSKLFPNPAFIFLTRDHDQVVKSGWWKSVGEIGVKRNLEQFEATISTYIKEKNFVFMLEYSDMTSRTARLKELFEFLGAPYIEEKIDQVLATKHSYVPTPAKIQGLQVHLKEKKMPASLVHFFIDRINESIRENGPIILSGVAVLNPVNEDGYSLLVVAKDKEYPVTWGLASPVVGEKYPFPHARFSRYKSGTIFVRKGDVVELLLLAGNGQKECLAKLFIN